MMKLRNTYTMTNDMRADVLTMIVNSQDGECAVCEVPIGATTSHWVETCIYAQLNQWLRDHIGDN